MKTRVVVLCCFVLTLGCATKKPIDVETERAAIRSADADWAKAAQMRDPEAAASFLAPDAVMLLPHATALTGKEEIAAYMLETLADPSFGITWETTDVQVSGSGDIAYSLATNQVQIELPDGSNVTDHGKGLTIWKKQPDGTWKVAVDIFNSDAEMMPPAVGP